MKQSVLNIQPLSVSVSETTSKQSIPRAIVTSVPLSEPKRKSKRVRQQATGPRKRQKKLLTTIESSEEEEEEHEVKPIEKISTFKQPKGKSQKPWKPKIEKINVAIANEGNLVQMSKFYDLYANFEKLQIDISIVRFIISNKLKLKDIEGVVNQKVYARLIGKKALARKEDLKL